VTSTGQLDYILDAYTTTDRLPDANTFNPAATEATGLAGDPFTTSDSVKVVMTPTTAP